MKPKLLALLLTLILCLNVLAMASCKKQETENPKGNEDTQNTDPEDTTTEDGDGTTESEEETSDTTESEEPIEIDEGLEFMVDDSTQTCSVIDYTGNAPTVVIPDTYKGYLVTSIGDDAFNGCDSLTSVTIPNSVTSIGEEAFYHCDSLMSVTIGNSVTSIHQEAFCECPKLVEVINLSTLNIEAGSEDNGYVARYAKEVHSGTSKTANVNGYLFYTYNNVNYLLGYVGSDTALTLPANYNGQNYEIYKCAFFEREDLTSVAIPNSVTSIGEWAFAYLELTSIEIPNSVTSIDDSAFSGCYKLVEVINHSSLDITAGSSSNGYVACDAIEVHSGTSKIVNVNGYLFYTYDNVNYLIDYVGTDTALTLPANYNGQNYEIYKCAFYEREDLTSVAIPNSVTSIGRVAFCGCTSLMSVTIGNGVTSIGDMTFFNCYGLTSVTFENTQGWKAESTEISSNDLANAETAASYLKETYDEYTWTRS